MVLVKGFIGHSFRTDGNRDWVIAADWISKFRPQARKKFLKSVQVPKIWTEVAFLCATGPVDEGLEQEQKGPCDRKPSSTVRSHGVRHLNINWPRGMAFGGFWVTALVCRVYLSSRSSADQFYAGFFSPVESFHAFVCVCVCVCTCVCVCVCPLMLFASSLCAARTHACACKHICMYVCGHVCMYPCFVRRVCVFSLLSSAWLPWLYN